MDYRQSLEITVGVIQARRQDGQVLNFSVVNDVISAPSQRTERLLLDAGIYQLTLADNTLESYNASGQLLSIRYPSGLTHSVSYASNTVTVTRNNYSLVLTLMDNKVISATLPDSSIINYSYDTVNGIDRLLTVTYADSSTRTYFYENAMFAHYITGIQDENGNRISTVVYDDQGRAISSEKGPLNSGIKRTQITYHEDGTRTVTNALGNQNTYHFTEFNGEYKMTQVEGHVSETCAPAANQTYTYDSNGFMASKTNWNGNVTNYIHNDRGLETSRTEAVGSSEERTITTEWHATFRLPIKITEPGWEMTFTYDAMGRLLTRTEMDTVTLNTHTRTNTYNAQGLVATIDGARIDVSDITTFDYDLQGNLIKTTNALGHETNITAHDALGRALTIVDANNTTTTLSYDIRGRLLTHMVDGQTTTFEYDGVGNITQTTLPDAAFLINEYDAAQRLVAVEDNLGNRIEYTLDPLGNRIQIDMKDPDSTLTRTLSRTYDCLSRLIETIDGEGQMASFAYDNNGNQTSITLDPTGLNQQTIQAFDALNRLMNTTDADNGVTIYTYDARDNLTSVTDAEGLSTAYTYDGLDNLTQQESPDTGITAFTYDDAGNRLSQTDARGITGSYSYDALNRLTQISYPDATQNVSYTYDTCTNGIGRLCQMDDESGTTTYTYDARGNLDSQTATIDSIVNTTRYAYDGADQITQLTYPSGRTVDYSRNGLGQIDSVTSTLDGVTETLASSLTYQPFGPLDGLIYGNDLVQSKSYDLDYRLTQLITMNGNTHQDLAYTLDKANNITTITNLLDNSRSQALDYDDLNRLSDATSNYGDIDYTYDAIGNRLSETIDGYPETYRVCQQVDVCFYL